VNPLAAPDAAPHLAAGTKLSVNLNKVALLRNARPLPYPSVVDAAVRALEAGAHGITVHPRPDARHIRESDVRDLAALLAARAPAEFNIEGNPHHNLLPLVLAVRPQQATFVPDAEGQSTSDHGFDLLDEAVLARLEPCVAACRALGVRVSLFVDALPDAHAMQRSMAAARALGADRVELYTEPWAVAFGHADEAEVLDRFATAARCAAAEGLGVNAGHDLTRANLPRFIAGVPGVQEVSIGHALIADALEFGLAGAVRGFLAAMRRAPDAEARR
jgi:pyridoxine 5-phosphate synthase